MEALDDPQAIAVIGMAGRFPGAPDVTQYWRNIVTGLETISRFSDEEMRAAGVPAADLADPNYVRAAPVIDSPDQFDAGVLGMTGREAELLDPQHRVFLEITHGAFLNAGYDPFGYAARVGVFAGSRNNEYLGANVVRNAAMFQAVGPLMAILANHTDYLATRVAYQFGFRGPAMSVVTACSTSLVAVHLAVRALRGGECEMAVAGGVEIPLPAIAGYRYADGGIFSPDGRVRTFDAQAKGTVFGAGCGAVLLKPLVSALADGDIVHAVIRGCAVNNDGSTKSAFSQPSEQGQVEVVAAALRDAGVPADSLGYVEAHGTGTYVGDPIEFRALSTAIGEHTDRVGFCTIGSVKANIGHLGAAAGVAGLIKSVLAVKHGVLPPSINVTEPNPQIHVADSPFVIRTEVEAWPPGDAPRRAAVSSFGIGGTNAHVILEQAPDERPQQASARRHQLLTVSARTETAFRQSAQRLADHLSATSPTPADLANVAHTLAAGRTPMAVRGAVVAADAATAGRKLAALQAGAPVGPRPKKVAFLFPGQGAQYVGMGRDLYECEPVFAKWFDACADALAASHRIDLRSAVLFADDSGAGALSRTALTQPALFAVEFSLAQLLRESGLDPSALAGHSIGEYVAAACAGVFSLEDGLRLVADRGALMQELPGGSMVAVRLPESYLVPMLTDGVSLAAVNAPGTCVVSGPDDEIADLQQILAVHGISCRSIATSHAFHSAMMEPVVDRFRDRVAEVTLAAPRIPFVSNLTGRWITDEDATDPRYWARHVRGCVRFADAVELLHDQDRTVLVEVGPGRTLSGANTGPDAPAIVPTMRHVHQQQHDVVSLLEGIGRVWTAGGAVESSALGAGPGRRRVELPTYPYERQRYWVVPDEDEAAGPADRGADTSPFAVPAWRETAWPTAGPVSSDTPWVIFVPGTATGPLTSLADRLRTAGARVLTVEEGDEYSCIDDAVTLRRGERSDYDRLLAQFAGDRPDRLELVHAWSVGNPHGVGGELEAAPLWLDLGFHSALLLMQASQGVMAAGTAVRVHLVSSAMQDVLGDGAVEPAKAALVGLVRHAGKEFENLTCRSIDLAPDPTADSDRVGERLHAELTQPEAEEQVAHRGRKRWRWGYDCVRLDPVTQLPSLLRPRGVYLITGGLGGLGLVLARQLAELAQARLVLLGRTPLPHRSEWAAAQSAAGPDDAVADRIRAVVELEQLGAEVVVLAADVTDEAQMRQVRATVLAEYGEINGVFHLAAVPGGGMLEVRTREAVDAVFAPKVIGTYVLDEVFGADIDLMVLYSSITVFTADFGLADYSGANAVMDAFAQRRCAQGRRVMSINWPAWSDVGMAVDIDRPKMLQTMRTSGAATPTAHPMLLRRYGDRDRTVEYEVNSSGDHWVLAEHALTGRPTMPGTGIVELVRAACADLTGCATAEISDLVFPRLLIARPDETVWLTAIAGAGGRYDVQVVGRRVDGSTVEYARGRVRAVVPPAQPPVHDVAAARADCALETTPAPGSVAAYGYGPRWDNITRRSSGTNIEVLDLGLADQYAGDVATYVLHPALLDSATAIGQFRDDERADDSPVESFAFLPFGYDRLRVHDAIPARAHAIIRQRPSGSSDVHQADVVVVDPTGREVVAVEGFTLTRRRDDAVLDTDSDAGQQPASGEAAGVPTRRAYDVGGLLDPDVSENGVLPEEASEVLVRILAHADVPQMIWCPMGLAEGVRRTAKVTRNSVAEQTSPATVTSASVRTLDTPYVEPATDTERVLAQLWQDALGLDRVGIDDDFFDLAGNSLVAVQLVARIGQRFAVDVSVEQLFQGRSVRGLAESINTALLASVESMSDQDALEALRRLEAGG